MQSLKQHFTQTPATAPLGHHGELENMLLRDMDMKQAIGHHLTTWGFASDIGAVHEGSHIMLMIASQDPKGHLADFPYQNHWEAEVYIFALDSLINEFQPNHNKHIPSALIEDYQSSYDIFRERVYLYAERFQKEVMKDRKTYGNKRSYTRPDEDEMRGLYKRLHPMLEKLHAAIISPANQTKTSFTLTQAEKAMYGLNIRDLTKRAWNTPELFLEPNHNIYLEAL